jgi:hypothetical protein
MRLWTVSRLNFSKWTLGQVSTMVELDFFCERPLPKSADFRSLSASPVESCPSYPKKSIRVPSPISDDTSSQKSSSRAVACLETCHESHEACPEMRAAPMPDRVLDLRFDDYALNQSIKVIETKNENSRYACISYCWGKTDNLTTTTETPAVHMKVFLGPSCLALFKMP